MCMCVCMYVGFVRTYVCECVSGTPERFKVKFIFPAMQYRHVIRKNIYFTMG